MEKTNRCSVQFVCYGSSVCKYAKPYDKEYSVVSDVLRKFCIHYYDGHCTCKQAQEEACNGKERLFEICSKDTLDNAIGMIVSNKINIGGDMVGLTVENAVQAVNDVLEYLEYRIKGGKE